MGRGGVNAPVLQTLILTYIRSVEILLPDPRLLKASSPFYRGRGGGGGGEVKTEKPHPLLYNTIAEYSH